MRVRYHNSTRPPAIAPQCAWLLVSLMLLCVTNRGLNAEDQGASVAPEKYFSESVLPLLEQHCYECHSHAADAAEGGLVLDSQAGWRVGGDSGPAIVVGEPAKSLLMSAVDYANTDLQMPPAGKLSAREIDILRTWIANGAFDPRITDHHDLTSHRSDATDTSTSNLWSLQPTQQVDIPQVEDHRWARNGIDRFVLARLQRQAIRPNGPADKYALLRRATFDLTGLPPTLEQISQFENDDRPDAYERLIDRLLASPQYGERWGRHWLDLARYGDSNGGDINYAHANAWRYRDYVIKAFNDDKPYNAFIRDQLAGDLLNDGSNANLRREQLTATGFLMLGPKMLAEVDTDKLLIDIVDEQLDVTGLTFLGMTFGCARCHDHKFDPITAEDYYAMAGIFRSTKVIDVLRPENGVSEWLEIDVTPAETRARIQDAEREQQRLEGLLADLGESLAAKGRTKNAADKSILTTKLPALRSTTWTTWVRIAAPQKLGGVISAAYDGADQGHSLGFDQRNTPRIVWNHGSGAHTIIAARQPITYGQWHHLGLVFDASTGRLKLFVDGSVAATASDVATSEFHTIGVGRREASKQFPFLGDVDDVRIYDVALADAQVHELFSKRIPPRIPLVSPLLHWSFDQLTGDRVVDEGPGRFDGQLIGVSAEQQTFEAGVIGAAFSFHAVRKDSRAEAGRRRQVEALRTQVQELQSSTPDPTLVMAVAATQPVDLHVHLRGSHLKLASTPTARGTPRVFSRLLTPANVPSQENGRLQLANWIASRDNPLTARVMVNRIWQHHFGHGLVRTPSNFGARGEEPSHPRLLDWLALEFVDNNWSVKHLHRLIMNSATYRSSSRKNADATLQDPDNRLLASYPVRRLEAEAIRDALLAVTGDLDLTMGGTLFEATNKKRVAMSPTDPVYDRLRRSVYLPAVRVRGYAMFSVFDVSENGQHIAARPQTLVAQQALFLMNNPFVLQRTKQLAHRVSQQSSSAAEQADWLYRTLYARPPNASEIRLLTQAYSESSESHRSEQRNDLDTTVAAWQQMIHAMICANEFIHIR